MTAAPLIHVVDDNSEIRSSIKLLLESVDIDVKTYADGNDFLSHFVEKSDRSSVLLLDVRMPGISGMVLLERLRGECPSLPILMLTGHGDIDMAVRAMKLGATDFITKPFSSQHLLDRIQEVLQTISKTLKPTMSVDEMVSCWSTLTVREREIFDRIVSGDANKVIALDMGISIRTVESHRANIMKKMKAKTLVDLVLRSVSLNRSKT